MKKMILGASALACAAAVFASVQPTPTAAVTQNAAPSPAGCASIPLAGKNAGMVTTPSSASAWGGERAADSGTLSDRVVSYKIDATLDPVKHTVKGQQQLGWRNRSAQPVCSVYLHLYLNAFKKGSTFRTEQEKGFKFRSGVTSDEKEAGDAKLLSVMQNGQAVKWQFVQPDGGPKTDQTVVRLDLPMPVAAGATTQLDIAFENKLPRVVARTGYFDTFHLVGQWFPKIGVLELPGERGASAPRWNAHEMHLHSEFYADFGSYDVKLTVPDNYIVGATGALQGAPVRKNGWTTHHYAQDDVHDFAWTAYDKYGTPLESTWRSPAGHDVKVRVLYPKGYEASGKFVMKSTVDSLDYFSKTLGAYPYKTVTAVVPAYNADEAGGMEYPTFFTATLTEPSKKGYGVPDLMLDFVTIHEFGHGYFYGILASNEFEEPMLDEGMNEYWDMRMVRDLNRGPKIERFDKKGFVPFNTFAVERVMSRPDKPEDPLGNSAWNRKSSQSYTRVYQGTSTVMHDIEVAVGRESMERAVKLYYDRWKFRHPSIADLEQALIDGTGRPDIIKPYFAAQIYGAKRLNDRIASVSTAAAASGFETRVDLRRSGVALPRSLVVTFKDGSRQTRLITDAKAAQNLVFTSTSPAVSAALDPSGGNYLDINLNDNARTVVAVDTGSYTTWARAAFQTAFGWMFAL